MILTPVSILSSIKSEFGSKIDDILTKLNSLDTKLTNVNNKLDSLNGKLTDIEINTQKGLLLEHVGTLTANETWTSPYLDVEKYYRYMHVIVCNVSSVSSGWRIKHYDSAYNLVWEGILTFSPPRKTSYGHCLVKYIQIEFINGSTAATTFNVYFAGALIGE